MLAKSIKNNNNNKNKKKKKKKNNNRFPAHDELGMCRTSLVIPKQFGDQKQWQQSGVLTEVTKGSDDLLHQGLQDLPSCLGCVGHNGLPHMNSCLAHSVTHISSGHEQQCQHLSTTTIISAGLAHENGLSIGIHVESTHDMSGDYDDTHMRTA